MPDEIPATKKRSINSMALPDERLYVIPRYHQAVGDVITGTTYGQTGPIFFCTVEHYVKKHTSDKDESVYMIMYPQQCANVVVLEDGTYSCERAFIVTTDALSHDIDEKFTEEQRIDLLMENPGLIAHMNFETTRIINDILFDLACLNANLLRWVPDEHITAKLCEICLRRDSSAWFYIPDKFKTNELWEKYADKWDSKSEVCYPEGIELSDEILEKCVKRYPTMFDEIPTDRETPELIACNIWHGWDVYHDYAKNMKWTRRAWSIFIERYPSAILLVTPEYINQDFVEEMIKVNPRVIDYVYFYQVPNDTMKFIEPKSRNKWLNNLEQDPKSIRFAPKEFLEDPLFLHRAVMTNKKVLNHIYIHQVTDDTLVALVDQDVNNIETICGLFPESKVTSRVFMAAARHKNDTLYNLINSEKLWHGETSPKAFDDSVYQRAVFSCKKITDLLPERLCTEAFLDSCFDLEENN